MLQFNVSIFNSEVYVSIGGTEQGTEDGQLVWNEKCTK